MRKSELKKMIQEVLTEALDQNVIDGVQKILDKSRLTKYEVSSMFEKISISGGGRLDISVGERNGHIGIRSAGTTFVGKELEDYMKAAKEAVQLVDEILKKYPQLA